MKASVVFRWFLILIGMVFLIAAAQTLYYGHVYQEAAIQPTGPYDLVLMYGGSGSPDRAIQLALAGKADIFVSGDRKQILDGYKKLLTGIRRVQVDTRPRTTDQNARDSVPFIKVNGYRRVALLTKWYHIPRALFLTKLYLWGSGVEVIPCVNEPVPPGWWRYKLARLQLFKLYGSFGRIFLHCFGIDDWPRPEWMPNFLVNISAIKGKP